MILLLLACPGDEPDDSCADGACDSNDSLPTGDSDSDSATSTSGTGPDADADGWRASLDCDDADPEVNPGQTEICYDGVDNNCSGDPDECGWIGDLQAKAYGHSLGGEDANDAAGIAVAAGGDVNGDGAADILVGAPDHSEDYAACGVIYVVAGPVTEDLALESDHLTRYTGASEHGFALGSRVGFSPDLDGDGREDLVAVANRIGASDAEDNDAPYVYVLSGAAVGAQDIDDHAPLLAAAEYDGAGSDLATAPDIDGDGAAELLIGAPDSDTSWWLSGASAGASIADGVATVGEAGFGTAVAFVGDLDGDGLEEWAASGDAGVWIFALGDTGLDAALASLADDDDTHWGSVAGTLLGGGDLDADGRDDFLASSPTADVGDATSAGRACVWSGAGVSGSLSLDGVMACYTGQHDAETMGTSLSAPGDVDSDDIPDLMLGSPGNSVYASNIGAVLVFSGPPSGTLTASDARATIYGESAWQHTGTSLSGGAELTGDGYTDIVIGAPGATVAATNSGAAFVLPGIVP